VRAFGALVLQFDGPGRRPPGQPLLTHPAAQGCHHRGLPFRSGPGSPAGNWHQPLPSTGLPGANRNFTAGDS